MNSRILMRDIVGGPYHPPLWRCHSTDAKQAKSDRGAPYIYWGYSRWDSASTIVAFCHSTEAKQAVMAGQLTAVVVCTHGQRAVEQRPRIAAARGVSDTVSHWRTRTARNHIGQGRPRIAAARV